MDLIARPSMQSRKQIVVASCRVFLDELKIMDLLRTFQQYFFMAAGDWAENLTDSLCAHIAQRGVLHEHSVQSMVDSSLKGTSVELDSSAADLKAALKIPSSKTAAASRASQTCGAALNSSAGSHSTQAAARAITGDAVQQLPGRCQASVTIDRTQLKALDAVQLSFDVQWPLSLIVTQVQLRKGTIGIMHTVFLVATQQLFCSRLTSDLPCESSAGLLAVCTQLTKELLAALSPFHAPPPPLAVSVPHYCSPPKAPCPTPPPPPLGFPTCAQLVHRDMLHTPLAPDFAETKLA